MCKSKAQGGQRCVGHATQRLAKAQEKKTEVEALHASGGATAKQVATARAANWKALVEYASTGAGSQALRSQWAQIGDPAHQNAKVLQGAIDDGALLAQSNRRAENEFRASQDKGPLSTPVPLTMEQQEALDVAARQRAEIEEVRRADPLGLRQAAEAGTVTPTPVAQPVLPTRPNLPTRPPVVAPPVSAREQRAEEARLGREAKAAETERLRAEKAAQSQRARDERAAMSTFTKLQRSEQRRLKDEVTAEFKAIDQWFNTVGTKKFSAPTDTWSGPSRWSGQTGPGGNEGDGAGSREQAYRSGYGDKFDALCTKYAGEYTPGEIGAAAAALQRAGSARATGSVLPQGWYSDYQTFDSGSVAAYRRERGANRADKVRDYESKYVAVNLDGVLSRARANRPVGSPREELVRAVGVRFAKLRATRRFLIFRR